MANGSGGFDLSAAWLRRAQGDSKAFMDAFATRMESALPGRVQVERRRDGLFSKQTHVVKVSVEIQGVVYQLELERANFSARRTKSVRGVVLKSEALGVPEWLAALNHDIEQLAGNADAASSVIHDFLMS